MKHHQRCSLLPPLSREYLNVLTAGITFFVTIYYASTRSIRECSNKCQCQEEMAAWFSELIFFACFDFFFVCSFTWIVNSPSDWQYTRGRRSTKDLRWLLHDKKCCQPTFAELHMQIGLCQHHCQTPVTHNEVGEEPCLIFMTQCCTCVDRDDWLELMRCELQCSWATDSGMRNEKTSLITVSDCIYERQHICGLPWQS